MKNPKVSVLIPVYRTNPVYLKEAIKSVLSQTFTDFELLILDDCPTNSRENVVRSFKDSRIRYFKNDKNMGITPSRNKLMELAQGEYLAVMDHDDVALSTRFAEQVHVLDTQAEIGVVGCWMQQIPQNTISHFSEKDQFIVYRLMQGCAIPHTGAMIRKSILGKIRYESEFTPAEDYALWYRLIGKTKFYNIQKVLMKYRWHGNNTSYREKKKMETAALKIQDFVRREHQEIWKNVEENLFWIVRLKLFGVIPLGKFKQKGNHCHKIWKWFPFIKIKMKVDIPLS